MESYDKNTWVLCEESRYHNYYPNITTRGPYGSHAVMLEQGQLLESVECHIHLYCFTFDDNNLNSAFVIIVLFPTKYSNKKACANGKGK